VLSAALAKNFTPDAAKSVNNDLHGSAAYRAHLVAVMAARAVEAAG
jgi:carbon-monoxide dehydrogenase medium subunit